MQQKVPQMHRRFMVPFKSNGQEAFSLLLLNANNYDDAIKIAKCIAGPNAEKFLCYKDFLVYD